MIGFQVLRNRGQFSSTVFVQSRPTKVLAFLRPSFSAARMTCLKWLHGLSGDRRVRIKRVG
jgi:hypothetical protein